MGNSYNTDDKSTANRLKRFIANRAVIVTIVTLLLAVGVIVAVILLAGLIYMLCRPYKEATKLSAKV